MWDVFFLNYTKIVTGELQVRLAVANAGSGGRGVNEVGILLGILLRIGGQWSLNIVGGGVYYKTVIAEKWTMMTGIGLSAVVNCEVLITSQGDP